MLMAVNFMASVFRGDKHIDDATRNVNVCIERYTSAIADLCYLIGVELMTFARGIQDSVDELSTRFGALVTTFEGHARLANCTTCQNRVRFPRFSKPMTISAKLQLERHSGL